MRNNPWDRWGRAAALITAAMVGGCYESDVPLDPTPQIEVDEAWLGTWRCLPFAADADEQPATCPSSARPTVVTP